MPKGLGKKKSTPAACPRCLILEGDHKARIALEIEHRIKNGAIGSGEQRA
jgi:hypothetical protein